MILLCGGGEQFLQNYSISGKILEVGSYEEHVNGKIAEQIEAIVNPVVSVTGGFPWQPEDEVTEGSPGPAAAIAPPAPVGIASTSS